MAERSGWRFSLHGRALLRALLALCFGATLAFASGPGSDSDRDDPPEVVEIDAPDLDRSDNSGSGSDDRDDVEVREDNSGSGSDDRDIDVREDNSGSGSADRDDVEVREDNSGSGGGDISEPGGGDNAGSGSGEGNSSDDDRDDASGSSGGDDNSGSGGGSDDNDNSGPGGGDNSGSGSGDGDDTDNSDSGSNSGSGSSDDEGEDDGLSSGSPHSGAQASHDSVANNEPSALRQVTVDQDEHGQERAAGEALLTGTDIDLSAAREAGFAALSTTHLPSLNLTMARLAVPDGMSVEDALARLRAAAPNAIVTANSIYRSADAEIRSAPPTRRTTRRRDFTGSVGIIDTGLDAADLERPEALVEQRAFAGPAPTPRDHGAAVATLAIDQGMRVHVADVFTAAADGATIASAESIAAALDWMVGLGVPVINVSIEGPNNAILAALFQRASARGHVIVAAAGNGGPSAAPAYPAAFEGAVAVTAIDRRDRPYLRANRGRYIAFAARGVDIPVRTAQGDLVVSGTSFAAPLVAAELARQLRAPSPERARAVLNGLRERAVDLGDPGRDPIFGWGAVRS
jgi:Subtilase family